MARNNKIRFRLAMLGALGLSLAGCGGDSSESPAPIAETTPEAPMKEQPGEVEQPRAVQQMMTLGTRQQEAGQVKVATSEARQWQPYERAPEFSHMVALPNRVITMSDGTTLVAKATLPCNTADEAATGPCPVVLTPTSYNTSLGSFATAVGGANEFLGSGGYAHVVVDVRGTGNSGGNWEAFGEREQQDYGEVVDWIVQQPWAQPRIRSEEHTSELQSR